MKRKPIRIDWESVEDAFNNQNDELVYYLDLVTGHVVLEGEGEAGDFDEDEGRYDTAPAPATTQDDATRLYVVPPDTEQKLVWLQAFLETAVDLDPEVAGSLARASEAEDPAFEIGEILRDSPETRDRWFLYRSERLHEMIESWVADRGIELLDAPPWR